MSLTGSWKQKLGSLALGVMTASVLFPVPAALARVGIGINLGFPSVVAPPIVVAPPVIAAPPVVVGPPPYYAPPPGYYYAPGPQFGVYWNDRSGHRHWRH